ncbi:MAG TPA: M28 family peptidase [Vicinamibacteria bacterium]|nr:M28 family peptidase [Vicinamibacteria bacterium]
MRPVLVSALVLAAAPGFAGSRTVTLTAAEKQAAALIRPEVIRAHTRFLASDLLEGRGPASRGDRLAQEYIAAQLEALGLEPAAPNGTFFQPLDIVGILSHNPETLTFSQAGSGGGSLNLRLLDDFIAFSGLEQPEVAVTNAEVVFVGYGIVAPEYRWDDYKGQDLKGKVLLMMNNDPEDDPQLFEGKTRLYYGRWDYKYEIAAEQGAAGAIIIHTTPSAGYPWQVVQTSWSGEQFALPATAETREVPVKSWVTEESARKLVELAGQNLDALRAAAQKRDFRPVPLGVQVSLGLRNDVQRKATANVLARLPGRDPLLAKEAVIYTAHHDHLGIKEDAKPGEDKIYNGALDNASGVGVMLAIARAMTSLPEPPRRSILFAAVAGEEQGLLGSTYLAAHPPIPAGRLAANINFDGASIYGRTRDLTALGFGKSDLDEWIVGLAALQNRRVVPDQFPDRGYYYRSDQFALAKIGVPAAYFDSGTEVIGQPPGWGKKRMEEFEEKHYHQPSDQLGSHWDFSGAVEDAQLGFFLGLKVASETALPAWKAGDEFEAARKKALAETGASVR